MKANNGMAKIIIGMGTCGLSAGAKEIYEAAEEFINKREINAEIIPTGCIGMCHKEVLLDIEMPNRTRVSYGRVRRDDIPHIIGRHILKGEIVKEKVIGQMRPEMAYISSYPDIPFFEDLPYNRKQNRIVLSNCGYIDPRSIDDYMEREGYIAVKKVVASFTPEKVIEVIKRSGLRGRGGAGFPTWKKWEFCRRAEGDIKYLICNADEGDPGAFMDRSVLEGDPHSLLEGMIISAFAIGASQGYIYVRAEYPLAIERLEMAISQARERRLLGKNILGNGFDFDIELRHGAGAFVCGEETALIASIEGRRGMPRPRPPFPATSGLWGRPTNINNVETLANISKIILNGADWYASFGTENSKGTKTFALTGDVRNVGLIEVPMGISLKEIIYEIGGGITGGRRLKAIQTGGPSGGCIPADLIDTPLDYESLSSRGTIMGSGGMVVLDDTSCMVDIAKYFLRFDMNESCGKCTPCRIGTKRMVEILERISNGEGRDGDIDLLIELGRDIKDASLCGLGQTAPNPALTTIQYFREEYDLHIKERYCPSASCRGMVYAPCQNRCPVGIDIPRYIALIGEGRFEDALEVIKERLPFPAICGRVCYRPCEVRCRRGEIDQPIAINNLKRFVFDHEYRSKISPDIRPDGDIDKKIAIVGSGPAGLTAAYYLAKKGYKVTIFEALPVVGGMLAVGIPEYRLPREILRHELEIVERLGVEIKTNTPIGKRITIKDLFTRGFDAVFLGIGAHKGLRLNIPGEDAKGVYQSIDFLRDVNLKKRINIKDRDVVVVGGGNVAMDAARTARRLGAKSVTILYRRERDDMPAHTFEIRDAEDEGIQFRYLATPNRILTRRGRIIGIECQDMELGEYDSSGRRRPLPIEGATFTIDTDILLIAIGQTSDISQLRLKGIEVTKEGRIKVDPVTLQTSRKGVFAGGDLVSGPGMVIEAIASGERGAIFIDRYLRDGEEMDTTYIFHKPERREERFVMEEGYGEKMRVEMPLISKRRRVKTFSEVERGFTANMAIDEAKRCLRCDLEE